uniref:Uncharacterized protein n=1 Tax=Triticum urartu TaxID=4572 RepID=A0A8R7UQF1_TRIUA
MMQQLETWPTALRKRPACEVIRMMPTYQECRYQLSCFNELWL